MYYGINYTILSIVKTKGIVNEKRRGKKYPDLEITFLAFLLYNK